MSRTRQITAYEKARIKGDRSIRYYFFSDPSLDYFKLAEKYREYLIEEENIKQREEKPTLNLRIFCGIEKKGFLSNEFVTATTFAEAREIIAAFVQRDITEIIVTLVGWSKGGYYGSFPNKLPPAPKLGGEKGLKELVEYAHSCKIPVYLDTDYLIAIQGNRGFSTRKDVIKQEMEIPITDNSGTYLLSTMVAYERFAVKEIPRLAKLGVDGIVINNLGDILLSDHDRKNRLQRDESKNYLINILKEFEDNGLKVMITGRNDYTFPYTAGFQQIPPFGNRHYKAPDEILFYSAVLHSLIPCYSRPLNLSEDMVRDHLRTLEYGLLPSFELTYRDPVVLRETSYNHLYSSLYLDWLDRIGAVYNDTVRRAGYLNNVQIVKHEELVPGVYRTNYKDGSQIIVNYGNNDFHYNGKTVIGGGFCLVPGLSAKPGGGEN
jgi:hypothetical protein